MRSCLRRLKKILLITLCGISLQSWASDLSQESPQSSLDIIFTNIDLIELSTENLQKNLFQLEEKLKESQENLQTVEIKLQTSNLQLQNAENLLTQATQESILLEKQLAKSESKLKFYRISTIALTVSTVTLTTILVLQRSRK